jgi:protein MpaA
VTDERPYADRGRIPLALRPFGRSRLGAPLLVTEPAAGAGGLLVKAGIHGEEPETTVLLSRALRTIAPDALRCAVVPCANPDGIALGTRGNAAGVDLNRNFPASGWSDAEPVHRWQPDRPQEVRLSPGEAPVSEPETRALLGLFAELSITVVVTLHTPLACVESYRRGPLARRLAERSGLPLIEKVDYETPGSLANWGAEHGVDVITYELEHATRPQITERHLPVVIDLLTGAIGPVG